jgi:hypothetical protein
VTQAVRTVTELPLIVKLTLSKLAELSPRFHCCLLDRVFRELTVLEHAGRQPEGRLEQGPQQ